MYGWHQAEYIEFSEGLFEAARREIKEETGLEITNLKVKAVGTAYLKDLNQELFFHFITADYLKGKLKQSPEEGELAWLTPKEIQKLPNLLSEIHEVLPYIFAKDESIISHRVAYAIGNKMANFNLESPKQCFLNQLLSWSIVRIRLLGLPKLSK